MALLSREAAERFWPGREAIGQRIRIGGDPAPWIQIVGIVGDVRIDDVSERADPQFYLPFAQNARSSMVVMVRSHQDPVDLAGPVRHAVWKVDPDQPIDDIRSMEQALYDDASGAYVVTLLFVSFALFALAMAAIGIYGVMSYSVSQRAGEISIRLALGAQPGHVRRMILGQGGKLVVVGAGFGLAGAFLISRLLSSVVFGITASDPMTFIGVPAVLGGIALFASYLPARRATRIDPMATLRTQ